MGAESSPTVAKPSLSKNRRRSSRHSLEIPATVFPENRSTEVTTVKVTALSVAGVGLRSQKHLEPGAIYQLDAFDSLIPVGMRVRIISSRKESDDRFEIGAEVV